VISGPRLAVNYLYIMNYSHPCRAYIQSWLSAQADIDQPNNMPNVDAVFVQSCKRHIP